MDKLTLKNVLSLLRIDHWIKNVLILPGFFIAAILSSQNFEKVKLITLIYVIIVTSFASSANYLINEYLDKESDIFHPTKKYRISIKKKINWKFVLVVYIGLVLLTLSLALSISKTYFFLIIVFFCLAILYNVPPFRLKDKPIIDIYLESLNSPIRFIIGWVTYDPANVPPLSIVLTFLTGGAFLMTAKRLSELKVFETLPDKIEINKYRKSFNYYSQANLFLILQVNFGLSILFISIFTFKYNNSYVFFIPFIIFMFAIYTMDSIKKDQYVMEKPHYLFSNYIFVFTFVTSLILFYVSSELNFDIVDYLFEINSFSINEFISKI